MKNSLVVLIILIFTLTGCDSQVIMPSNYFDEAYKIVDSVETSEEIVEVIARHSWAEAYFNALSESWFPSMILLVDIDFNGIPELFFIHWGSATNMWIDGGFSYQNGEVIDIEFYDEWGGMPSELSLLQNKRTDEQVWLAQGRFSSNAGIYQYWVYEFIDFSNLSQVQSKQVFAFDSEMILNQEGTHAIGSIYSYRSINNETIEMPFEEIEERRERIFRDFETIEVQILLIHRTQVFTNCADLQDIVLSRDKVISHFNEWE